MLTARLELRPPSAADRTRFVGLFRDDDFMIFSGGPLSVEAAVRRFDDMLERVVEFPFAKQPVVERSSETIRTSLALGFRLWRHAALEGELRYIGRREIGGRNAADPIEDHGVSGGG